MSSTVRMLIQVTSGSDWRWEEWCPEHRLSCLHTRKLTLQLSSCAASSRADHHLDLAWTSVVLHTVSGSTGGQRDPVNTAARSHPVLLRALQQLLNHTDKGEALTPQSASAPTSPGGLSTSLGVRVSSVAALHSACTLSVNDAWYNFFLTLEAAT